LKKKGKEHLEQRVFADAQLLQSDGGKKSQRRKRNLLIEKRKENAYKRGKKNEDLKSRSNHSFHAGGRG